LFWRTKRSPHASKDSSIRDKEDVIEEGLNVEKSIQSTGLMPLLPKEISENPMLRNRSDSNVSKITLSILQMPDIKLFHGKTSDFLHAEAFPKTLSYQHASNKVFSSEQSKEQRDHIIEKILRFRRECDRFSQLASILLKSRAYHLHHLPRKPNNSSIFSIQSVATTTLPVVELCRTDYRKPYIPPTDDSIHKNIHILSISHQEPVVASAQFFQGPNSTQKKFYIGMDIVVTTSIEKELKDYNFLKLSFTKSEWEKVSRFRVHSLDWAKEILLIWCMKEAYTKALGLGMGLEFSNFEIKLDDTDCEDSTWNKVIKKECFEGIKKRGRVIHDDKQNLHSLEEVPNENDFWNFTFFDGINLCTLVDPSESENKESPLLSCICVCDGPHSLDSLEDGTSYIPIDVEIMSLSDLTQWHFRENEVNSKKV